MSIRRNNAQEWRFVLLLNAALLSVIIKIILIASASNFYGISFWLLTQAILRVVTIYGGMNRFPQGLMWGQYLYLPSTDGNLSNESDDEGNGIAELEGDVVEAPTNVDDDDSGPLVLSSLALLIILM